MTDEARGERREGFAEFAEDAVGFGGQELRLARDLVLRPGAVMDAYDAKGSMAGGLYPRPLRFYLTLMGLYLLVIALLGGMERQFSTEPMAALFNDLARAAGKTTPEVRADFEQWYSLISLPITIVFFGGASYLLIRKWSPAGDRHDLHQTFTYLNAYSVIAAPLGLVAIIAPSTSLWTLPLTFIIMAVTFARVGKGRWWRTGAGAWGKGALLLLLNLLALLPASLLMGAIALGGARYLP